MFSVKKDKAAASGVVVGGVSKEGPAVALAAGEELGQENKLDVAMSKEEKVREEEDSFQPTMTTAATAATNGNKNNKSLTKAILDPTKNIESSSTNGSISLQWKILQPLEEKEEQKNKEKNAFQLQRVSYYILLLLLVLLLKNECRSFKSRLILVVAGMKAAKAFYLFLT